ncbi:MAG: secondary thiamine-phosphate synthase enzyme YjbQ [Candidatus Omnitrophica bacterium]|nr:secondary thiamine-phosphate synthase enzyme YjbQ [Candidatus Omnitrophota bacterium]
MIIKVESDKTDQVIDITSQISDVVKNSKIGKGICYVYVPHTTAAVTINENADPDVKEDFLKGLGEIVPDNIPYKHSEGNSPAHIKASMIGAGEMIIVEDDQLLLGVWQGIYFCEFDGPRQRKVYVKVLEG